MHHLLALLALLALPPCTAAASLTLYLPAAPNPFALPPSTHATLSAFSKYRSAPLSSANTFVFHNVTPGSYLADVHCATDGFRPLRIDVSVDQTDGAELVQAWDTFRGNEWGNKGELVAFREGSAGKGVEVKSIGKKIYFVDRPTFSILSILKNPMILMGLVSMVIFIGMPKLVENMDPETKAEFEASQRNNPLNAVMGGGGGGGAQQQNPLGNFDMAAFLAGSGKKDGEGQGNANHGRNQPVRRG